MKKIAALLIGIVSVTSVSLAFQPVTVSAQGGKQFENAKRAACDGLLATTSDNCDDGGRISKVIQTGVNILSMVVGVAAIFMIILAGFRYITSRGEAGGISSAKNTLLYAIVGLVVVAFAQIIVRFVFDRLK